MIGTADPDGTHVWRVCIIPPDAADDILDAAIMGHEEARKLLQHCADTHRRIKALNNPAPGHTLCCLTCGAAFWKRHAPEILLVIGELGDDLAASAIFGICAACRAACSCNEDLKSAILAGCRVRFDMPDLRQLPPFHATPGHA
jgi:hypothetical protein